MSTEAKNNGSSANRLTNAYYDKVKILNLLENIDSGTDLNVSITGTADAAVFRTEDGNGIAESDGIFNNTGTAGYTMNLDRSNKRVGVNQATPLTTLDIGGNAQVVGTDTIKLENDTLGIITSSNELKLYSANLFTIPSDLTTVDSLNKKTGSSSFRSYDPDAVDVANTKDESSIYKIQLLLGTTKQTVATSAFDIQENYAPLSGFPTSQIVEYQNKVPLNKPICVSRTAGPQIITPSNSRVVTSLGTRRGSPFFDDNVIYDPCQMRAKLTGGTGWNSFGAPVAYRVADLKVGWTINWNISGTWGTGSSNVCYINLTQYRSGSTVPLRTIRVQQLEADKEFSCIGSRTLLSWTTSLNEDFDPTTDYYEVELTNKSTTNTLTFTQADITAECWLAQ